MKMHIKSILVLMAIHGVLWGGIPDPQLDKQGSVQKTTQGQNNWTASTVSENQRYFDLLVVQDPDLILDTLLETCRTTDGVKIGLAVRALSQVLQQSPEAHTNFFIRMREAFISPTLEKNTKMVLASAMGRAATVPALQVLYDASKWNTSEYLLPFQSLANAVSQSGDHRWNGRFHPELGPVLLQFWQEGQDPKILRATASAIAKVGDPAGIEILINEVLNHGSTMTEVKKAQNERAMIALAALTQVRNPDIIEPLVARLNHRDPDDTEVAICTRALASFSHPRATRALLTWMQGAEDEFAPLAQAALSRINDEESLKVLKNGLSKGPTFRGIQIKHAVTAFVEERPQPQRIRSDP